MPEHKPAPLLLLPGSKINIGLNVVARRPDGYHDLETVFYPIPLRDNLEITPAPSAREPWRLSLGGIPCGGEAADNLVVRVYLGLAADYPLPPVEIFLRKNIPSGAGLGGGSSDAAFMMKGLNELFSLGMTEEEMERRLARLGADCAFFVKNRPAFATGIGDRLSPLALSLAGRHIVLVKPPVHVSTAEAYAGVTPHRPEASLRESVLRPIEEWRGTVENDFEPSVFARHPQLAAIKRTLYDMGALYAAMSGSGSTVYGIFARPAEEAARVFGDCFVYTKRLV